MLNDSFYHGTGRSGSRYDDLLKEAECARLERLANAHQSSFGARAFSRLGDFLIACGLSLKQRYEQDKSQAFVLFMQAGQKIEA